VLKIAVIPGDGIGPEVICEGLKVLAAAAGATGLNYELTHYDFGGDRYLATGEVLPDGALEELRGFDVIYLGAVGHPEVPPGVLERGLLLALRFGLDQYVNLRPIKLYPGVWTPIKDKGPEEIDFVVVRENTEDVYVGTGGFMHYGTPDEVATQVAVYSRRGTERIIRYAFELTRARNRKKKLTLCDKANVLTFGHDLWQRVFKEVGEEYPDVEKDQHQPGRSLDVRADSRLRAQARGHEQGQPAGRHLRDADAAGSRRGQGGRGAGGKRGCRCARQREGPGPRRRAVPADQ